MPDTESDKTGFPNLLWYKALYFDKISVTEKRVKPRMSVSDQMSLTGLFEFKQCFAIF
jgi:hypothetical protein